MRKGVWCPQLLFGVKSCNCLGCVAFVNKGIVNELINYYGDLMLLCVQFSVTDNDTIDINMDSSKKG